MGKIIQEKFDGYKKIIKSNIETIESLITQSDLLAELVLNIKDDETKKSISSIQENLQISIKDLLKNTNQLFDKYENLIKDYAKAS